MLAFFLWATQKKKNLNSSQEPATPWASCSFCTCGKSFCCSIYSAGPFPWDVRTHSCWDSRISGPQSHPASNSQRDTVILLFGTLENNRFLPESKKFYIEKQFNHLWLGHSYGLVLNQYVMALGRGERALGTALSLSVLSVHSPEGCESTAILLKQESRVINWT